MELLIGFGIAVLGLLGAYSQGLARGRRESGGGVAYMKGYQAGRADASAGKTANQRIAEGDI